MPQSTSRQNRAKIYFALGHQRRLKILEVLEEFPNGLTYEDLGVLTKIPEGSLTHHLRILKDANFISRKVRDRYSYYHLKLRLCARYLRNSSKLELAA